MIAAEGGPVRVLTASQAAARLPSTCHGVSTRGPPVSTAKRLLKDTGISPDTYVRDLTDDEVVKLREAIDEKLTVEGDLRRERSQNVKRLQEIGCYRGLRHRRGMPVRGQRTKTNARTRKGPRRMQVAGRKKATKK